MLAGTVDQHVQESVDYFEQVIKPLIDQNQVTYIGSADMEQKIDLLNRARALLNPIEWEEPFGMVMIEAMALGCPVVAFDRGAASEIVAHGSSGFLVQNVKEMAHCISRIDELDRGAVRAHAEQHFTAHIMARKYTRMYKQVIASASEHVSLKALLPLSPTLVKTGTR